MLNNNKPFFTVEDASRMALELYGMHVEARALPGERDCNFHLKTDKGQELVLKIAPAVEQLETIDLQNKALEHLAAYDHALILPKVLPTTEVETIGTVIDTDGTSHFVRILTYIPGNVLAETRPHTPELLYSLGSLMGTMDSALLDFKHAAAHRTLKWDLQHTSWIHDYLHYIDQPKRRTIVSTFSQSTKLRCCLFCQRCVKVSYIMMPTITMCWSMLQAQGPDGSLAYSTSATWFTRTQFANLPLPAHMQ